MKDLKNSLNYTKGDVVLRSSCTVIRRTALTRSRDRESHDTTSVSPRKLLGLRPQSPTDLLPRSPGVPDPGRGPHSRMQHLEPAGNARIGFCKDERVVF